jgi:thiol-disulfide isomerase/thioredoxin
MIRTLFLAAALTLAAVPLWAAVALAPAWSLKTPDGQVVNFPADAQGRPTVLMFWPSWCPFSRALQPYVQDIWKDYRDAGVNVWTINIKEDRDPVAVLRERGLDLPLLVEGDAVANDYGLKYTPWLVVIDGRNRIVYTRPPKPPTPVHTAKEVRAKLNALLGERAVPLPADYPKPYDLHLRKPEDATRRLQPRPLPAAEANAWVQRYLASLKPDEGVADLPAQGPIADGKQAIRIARELWTARFGAEATLAQAPYRAYRQDRHWVVLGDGLSPKLGTGFVMVIEVDSGRVLRLAERVSGR